MSQPFTEAAGVPVSDATPVISFTPVVLSIPGRPVDLESKVSAPATGDNLPVILFSHGHGGTNFLASLRGYGPLVDFWAAHGFVVVQPTHLDAMELGLRDEHPDGPLFWRSRAEDMHHILDHLEQIEATVPGLEGRLDRSKIAAVGHSLGGVTTGLLCGQRFTEDNQEVDLTDKRIKVGVLIGAPGRGEFFDGAFVSKYPIMRTTAFGKMTTPALIVAGANDSNLAFSTYADWRADAYYLSPAPKSLLMVYEAEHIFGGISGYDASETTDENPERVALVRALTWAYLRTALYPNESHWGAATAALESLSNPVATIDSK